MVPTIIHLQRLASFGVAFHSYTEAHLSTDNELVRNILLALLIASLARLRRSPKERRPKWPEPKPRGRGLGGLCYHELSKIRFRNVWPLEWLLRLSRGRWGSIESL
jgi:hypothetical protein